jgi:hypothetical protein
MVGRAHFNVLGWGAPNFGHREPARTGTVPPGNGILIYSVVDEVGSGARVLSPAPNALSGTGSGRHGDHAQARPGLPRHDGCRGAADGPTGTSLWRSRRTTGPASRTGGGRPGESGGRAARRRVAIVPHAPHGPCRGPPDVGRHVRGGNRTATATDTNRRTHRFPLLINTHRGAQNETPWGHVPEY